MIAKLLYQALMLYHILPPAQRGSIPINQRGFPINHELDMSRLNLLQHSQNSHPLFSPYTDSCKGKLREE